ncbi:pre-mRNA-processing factor 19 [Citrus clementina]|uniref:pre-mRNA-processing factor 19 n=1 Tax=Citrus clementina TaxID=85681 RepID=UPI000CED7A75|nr:pre-mRNA-processing factor 19 [Citrus x clementina]
MGFIWSGLTIFQHPCPVSKMYVKHRSLTAASICGMLGMFQNDAAACRVIARLKKERDEAWSLLAQSERQPHKMRIWALLNRKYMLELLRHYC